jgi:hypothetical protein
MALSRLIVFVMAAVALAGCCASGTGCPVTLPPELATSDGRVPVPDDDMQPAEPSMGKSGRSKSAYMIDPGMDSRRDTRPKRTFAEQDAADQAADAELTRHLKICTGCGTSGRDDMAATGMDDSMGGGRAARGTSRPKAREMSNAPNTPNAAE